MPKKNKAITIYVVWREFKNPSDDEIVAMFLKKKHAEKVRAYEDGRRGGTCTISDEWVYNNAKRHVI